MKRALLILVGGLLIGLAAYSTTFLTGTSRLRAARSREPVLAWMKEEYQLSDVEYSRVCSLHDAYRSNCMAMCRRIDEKNTRLQQMLSATNVITPEIRSVLIEAAQIRAECQGNMLEHFYAVAQTMPPAQGKKYLAWIKQETLKPQPMLSHDSGEASGHHMQ